MAIENPIEIGVLGGSGLYNMPQLTDIEERAVDTPFGAPSAPLTVGRLNGVAVAFIPRHGRGHVYLPSEVPYRANIYALKMIGVKWVIAVSACGSLREDYAPGHIVVPDQLVDNTKDERGRTFFGGGLVAHVGVAEPFCSHLGKHIAESTRRAGGTVHEGGVLVTIEGPRFSTRGESEIFRKLDMSIIGMTTSPEAFLAREAGMCYAVMAHVTDYDVWHQSEEPVTVEIVIKTLQANLTIAQNALLDLVTRLGGPCQYEDALRDARMTSPDRIPAEKLEQLKEIVGKYY